jgi:hypothetical protein
MPFFQRLSNKEESMLVGVRVIRFLAGQLSIRLVIDKIFGLV